MKVEKKRWGYLIIGTVVLLFVGILYAWSLLKGAFADAFGWSSGQLATAYTLTISCFCLGCISGGFLLQKIGVRRTLLGAMLLSASGFFLVSRMRGWGIAELYLAYGLLAGGGIGMAYNSILAIIGAWFPDCKGLSSGILMMGFGSSTMIFGNLAAKLLTIPAIGWRNVFLGLAILMAIVLGGAVLILRLPTEEERTTLTKKCSAAGGGSDGIHPRQVVRTRSFWMLFAAMTLLGAAGSSVISFARDFALSVGVALPFAGILVGILSISNGLGRILAGWLYDRYGRKFIMVYICVMEIASCVLCAGTVLAGSGLLCGVSFILVGLSYGANTCAVSTIIGAFYGTKYFPQNLSLGLLTLLPSSFLAKLSSTLLMVTGGYLVPFAVMGCYGVVALGLNLHNQKP